MRITKTIIFISFFSSFCWMTNTYANKSIFLIGLGFDFGGERLAKLNYQRGNSKNVRSNQGFHLYLGFEHILKKGLLVKTNAGYKVDAATAQSGDVKFTRIPLEVLPFAVAGKHRLGAGPSYHVRTRYECKLSNNCNQSIK